MEVKVMDFWCKSTKIFALFLLFFANSILVYSQSVYELPSGTKFRVRMDNEISSKVSSVGDTFTMKISEPVLIHEAVALPIGTIIEGRVTKVRRASIGRKNGTMVVTFEMLHLAGGLKREMKGILVNQLIAESTQTTNILTVAGGTALGAIFGAISKSSSGALIGAGIGTGTGAGIAFLQKGKDVRIKAEEEFEIELTTNVVLPVQDF
jgi:hypothetical protein